MQTLNLGVIISEEALFWGIFKPESTRFITTTRQQFTRIIRQHGNREASFVSLAELFSEIPLPADFYPNQPKNATSNNFVSEIIKHGINRLAKEYNAGFAKIIVAVGHSSSARVRFFLRTIFETFSDNVTLINMDQPIAQIYTPTKEPAFTLCYNLLHQATEVSLYSYSGGKLTHLEVETFDKAGINALDMGLLKLAENRPLSSQPFRSGLFEFEKESIEARKKLYATLTTNAKNKLDTVYRKIMRPPLEAAKRIGNIGAETPTILFLSPLEENACFQQIVQQAMGSAIHHVNPLQILAALCGIRQNAGNTSSTNTIFDSNCNGSVTDKTKQTPEQAARLLTELRDIFSQLTKTTRALSPDILQQISDDSVEMAIRWSADIYIGQNRVEDAYKLYKLILPKDDNNMPELREMAAVLCLEQAKNLIKSGGERKNIRKWCDYCRHFKPLNPDTQAGIREIRGYLTPKKQHKKSRNRKNER